MTSKMLHYVVELEDGSRFDVHIDPNDPSVYTVDGVTRDVSVEAGQEGFVVTTEEGVRVPLRLEYEHGDLVARTPDGVRRKLRVHLAETDAFIKKVLSQPPPPPLEHSGRLTAPIAGNILSLCAQEGSTVKIGDPIVVLEAMKMQNTIPAPTGGIVRFSVTPGQTVRSGDLIASIEAKTTEAKGSTP